MNHSLYEVFKMENDTKFPWRVQMPNGVWPFKFKRNAVAFSNELLKMK